MRNEKKIALPFPSGYLIVCILTNLFFLNVCFAQQFCPSEHPAQIRMGVRGANSRDNVWGYTDIFFPVYNNRDSILYGASDFLIFLNPKITMTDFSTDEENFGAGFRYLASDLLFEQGIIFGCNVYYDTAYSENGCRHTQIGLGVEFLSQVLDLRTNYYLPASDKQIADHYYDFAQRSLSQYFKEEESLRGYDAEIGIPVPILSSIIETWVYGGGYWYNSTISENIEGLKARIQINPAPLITFSAEVKDDNVFGSDTFVGGFVSLPFDFGNLLQRKNPFEGWQEAAKFQRGKRSLAQRMTEPVIRDINIITTAKTRSEKAHDMIFVDNSNVADSLEDGSLDHPHNTLSEAFSNSIYEEGVWIYVNSGDGSSTGYTGNFTLVNRVVVWGQGYQYLNLGGGDYPKIDGGGAGNVFTLGNDNTIMGLQIQNGDEGIYGKNITSTEIRNNVITNNIGDGIHLETDSTYNLSAQISGNTIDSNIANGVVIWSEDSSLISAAFTQNTIDDNGGTGIYHWSGDSSTINTTFSGNTISSNGGSGIYLQSNTSSVLTSSLSRNKIYANALDGVYLSDLGSSILTLDMGNGARGCGGYNSVYSNGDRDVDNDTALTVKAENNWWGPALSSTQFGGDVDYNPYLSSDPN
ncbi:MAG: inverse autotransporter beta domain-containing protein [Candidatus Omnitrophota bacterium]